MATKLSPTNYYSSLYPYAKTVEIATGISAEFVLAQSALESGWGASAYQNNFFGIKAGSTWTGLKQLLTTTEYLNNPNAKFPVIISIKKISSTKYEFKIKDYFRAYKSPAEAFGDYAKFFFVNSRYKSALSVRSNPIEFAKAIQKAGYATDPNYANKIASIIKSMTGKPQQTSNQTNTMPLPVVAKKERAGMGIAAAILIGWLVFK